MRHVQLLRLENHARHERINNVLAISIILLLEDFSDRCLSIIHD